MEQVGLGWTPVAGAASYAVYRTDGVSGCDFGKVKIADVAGTSFTDTAMLAGRAYSYVVLPVGSNPSCFGRASQCATATPTAAAPCAPTADFSLTCAPSTVVLGPGGARSSTCTIQSQDGFAATVDLSCAGLPADVTCAYAPPTVTPPPDGSITSALTVTAGAAAVPGSYAFEARGAAGALVRSFPMTLSVVATSVAPAFLDIGTVQAPTFGGAIYEPNTPAVVQPAWRNTGPAGIVLTGQLTAHSGPAGATYSVLDDSAAYGSIPPGGSGHCTLVQHGQCYVVTNSATTRPVTHWDSTVDETVTPFPPAAPTTRPGRSTSGAASATSPRTSPFYRFVETMLHRSVTGGCTATNYCPSASTTREQMAVFVILSKEPPGYVPPACVAGVGGVRATCPRPARSAAGSRSWPGAAWCPGAAAATTARRSPVTREQMAVFVLRTLDPALNPPACVPPNLYADVPETSPFCRWIEELTARGVVTGCGGGHYCPANPVTREQMGVFLAVTFGLTLYGL